MKSAKVSVILPVYNMENYLKRCLDSILNQTFIDFEIIIINDGSIDNSEIICNEYALQDNRIKVITTKNRGLSSARNLGIDKSNGKYIIFCDSDDWIEKNAIEILVNAIEFNNCDMAICGYKMDFVGEKDNSISINCKNKMYESIDEFMKEYSFYRSNYLFGFVWNKIFRTSIVKKNKIYFEKNVFCEDLYFVFKFIPKCKRINSINAKLYHYMHQSNNTLSKKKKDEFKVMNDIYDRTKSFLIVSNSYEYNKEYLNSTYIESMIAYIMNYVMNNENIYSNMKNIYLEMRLIDAFKDFKSEKMFYKIMFFMLKNKLTTAMIIFIKFYKKVRELKK